MAKEEHGENPICQDTLSDLRSARFETLRARGVEPQAARLFAVMEADRRQALAREMGPDEALVAKLVWNDLGEFGISMELVLDDAPEDLSKRFIHGFEDLPTSASIDVVGEDKTP